MKIMHSLFHFDFTKNIHHYDLLTKNVLKKKDFQNIIPRHSLSYINTQTYKVMNQKKKKKKKTLKLIKL